MSEWHVPNIFHSGWIKVSCSFYTVNLPKRSLIYVYKRKLLKGKKRIKSITFQQAIWVINLNYNVTIFSQNISDRINAYVDNTLKIYFHIFPTVKWGERRGNHYQQCRIHYTKVSNIWDFFCIFLVSFLHWTKCWSQTINKFCISLFGTIYWTFVIWEEGAMLHVHTNWDIT